MNPTEPADHLASLHDYFELMNANGAAHVYREAVRAGILGALADAPGTSAQIAVRCELAARPVELMLAALASMGVTQLDGDMHSLTPLARALLGGSYRDLGDAYWSHLPAWLETGEPIVRMDDQRESSRHYQAQAGALAWMLAPAAQVAANQLTADGEGPLSIVDVGAGSAIWSLTLASRRPGSRVTAIDWPAVLEVARATAARLGLEDHLTLLPGDGHDIALPPAAFDIAIVANVTHLQSVQTNEQLFAKLCQSLKPTGRIVVVDVLPGQSTGDLNRALYALGLALRTQHGQVHLPQVLNDGLIAAGFNEPSLTPLDVPPYAVGMIVAARR